MALDNRESRLAVVKQHVAGEVYRMTEVAVDYATGKLLHPHDDTSDFQAFNIGINRVLDGQVCICHSVKGGYVFLELGHQKTRELS